MSPSCILWQNDRKTVVLLDIPRSIEEAQVPSSQLRAANGQSPTKLRTLVSAPPPESPFPTPEPKADAPGQPALSPSAQVAELMTLASVESALADIKKSYDGPWCLPRLSSKPQHTTTHNKPSPRAPSSPSLADGPPAPAAEPSESRVPTLQPQPQPPYDPSLYHLPPDSHPLPGTIRSRRATFLSTAPPQFDLIVLDPPWPNRSAKRKRGSYQPAADQASIRSLLAQVPVASRLAPDGLVAVWVTNAARSAAALLSGGGVFAEWGVELVGEWTWLKVTDRGEPVVGVDSRWRKPWERLLIARKRAGEEGNGVKRGSVEGKVIVSVPDVHSRKPNLRCLFEELLPERYEALEVFARNLTAGWWAWGDEVLLFQRKEYWVDEEEEDG
ncbi:hypothetical protein VTK56DRAFT_2788 [Thermocarpiscus australiensis]